MDRGVFERNLLRATAETLASTREVVSNPLPEDLAYLIRPNVIGWGPGPDIPLRSEEELFPEDDLPEGHFVGPLDAPGVVGYLWRRGKVPAGIYISIYATDERHTYVLLRSEMRFTALEEHRDRWRERPIPFNIRIPPFPPGWRLFDQRGVPDLERSLREHGRFEAAFRSMPPPDRLIRPAAAPGP